MKEIIETPYCLEIKKIYQAIKEIGEKDKSATNSDSLRAEVEQLKSKLEDRESYIQFLEKRNRMYVDALNDMAKIINQVNGPENYPWDYEGTR